MYTNGRACKRAGECAILHTNTLTCKQVGTNAHTDKEDEMALYGTINVRVPEDVYHKAEELKRRYKTQTGVVIAAINALHAGLRKEAQPAAVKDDSAPAAPVSKPTPAPKQAGKGNTRYELSDEGRRIIDRVRELYQVNPSPEAIAKALSAENIRQLSGKPFTRGGVNTFVKRHVKPTQGNA
jgi:hypothetical protein